MQALPPNCVQAKNWGTLYRAAVKETNRRLIPRRVTEAERAVLARRCQVFRNAGTLEEKEALDDALYALRALETAWKHTEGA